MDEAVSEILWRPSEARVADAALTAFMRGVAARHGVAVADYAALHAWSVAQAETFWREVWSFCGVKGEAGGETLRDGDKLPGAQWFPEARLNYAENLLRPRAPEAEVLIARTEDGRTRRFTYRRLHDAVSRLAQALQAAGVESGDRVAAIMPNCPETVIAMLAATSLGAVFSSVSPDFGVGGTLDRLGQIAPAVLIAADGYVYNGKVVPLLDRLREISARLPSLERVIVAPFLADGPAILGDLPKAVWWDDAIAPFAPRRIAFTRVPFNHPLFILYSSGTSGVPKCIVHGHGGTLLQHLKEHQLHGDIRAGDRVFFYTTCSWMMWNWLVSALASQATVLLYDGSPFQPDAQALFDFAAHEGARFSVSPPSSSMPCARPAWFRPQRTISVRCARSRPPARCSRRRASITSTAPSKPTCIWRRCPAARISSVPS